MLRNSLTVNLHVPLLALEKESRHLARLYDVLLSNEA